MSPTDFLSLTHDEAQKQFQELLETQRQVALWFFNPGWFPDITHPLADRILTQILQRGLRSAWVQARKLKEWRSHNFK